MNATNNSQSAALQQLFGENRAEWATAQFRELFVEPAYHAKLEYKRPCFLVGGRGTGKTTSLQSLHFRATAQRLDDLGRQGEQTYFGVLVRMNKNRVRAFEGTALETREWQRLFAHYFNLLVCLELCGLTEWLEARVGQKWEPASLALIAHDFGFPPPASVADLKRSIQTAISDLQLFVNNPRDPALSNVSMAEAPIRNFIQELAASGLIAEGMVFICVDEFENLLEEQQSVVNTYIKHAEPPLSYKIGVRKNGIRTRATLDRQDLLKSPDDYSDIEIADEGFELFAKQVAEVRLANARKQGINVPEKLGEFLADLTFEEEANLLGAERVAQVVRQHLSSAEGPVQEFFRSKSNAEVCFLQFWHETEQVPLYELASDWLSDETKWVTRLGNYGYSSLFALSKGNKGARIRKYYCGDRVLLSLAAGNIRYFLELLEVAIAQEVGGKEIKAAGLKLSPASQTRAAKDVGERRLGQLEGLADHGVQLKRLVLAIGRIFFERARSPVGKAPEVTSFVLSGEASDISKISLILSEGVGHLAFEVEPRTKATSALELKDDEYRLHRIFCAFFEISHRKKRRMTFEASKLLAILTDKPSKAIAALLGETQATSLENLPEQIALFSAFYDSTDVA